MSDTRILASEFDTQAVLYVDNMGLQHSGIVVGQSVDGNWVYVQSTRPNVPDAQWHFRVRRELIGGMLVETA